MIIKNAAGQVISLGGWETVVFARIQEKGHCGHVGVEQERTRH